MKEDLKKRKKNPHCRGTRKNLPKNNLVVRDLRAVLSSCPKGCTYPLALKRYLQIEGKRLITSCFSLSGRKPVICTKVFSLPSHMELPHAKSPWSYWGNTPFIHQADPKLVTEVEKSQWLWLLSTLESFCGHCVWVCEGVSVCAYEKRGLKETFLQSGSKMAE